MNTATMSDRIWKLRICRPTKENTCTLVTCQSSFSTKHIVLIFSVLMREEREIERNECVCTV